MTDFDEVDFFMDASLNEDPYPYFEHLRSKCPITRIADHGVLAVTGYDEASDVYRDPATFSSCNSVVGPFAVFPVPLEGDDMGAVIDAHRDQLPMNEHMVTMDPPQHTWERAICSCGCSRRSASRRTRSSCGSWRNASSTSSSPAGAASSSARTRNRSPCSSSPTSSACRRTSIAGSARDSGSRPTPASSASDQAGQELNALGWLDDYFATYIEERRREPRRDVLTDLALAKYPDGSTPDVTSVVRTATFLFAAGQETTARLLATGLKYLAENPDLQDELRAHKDRIPDFVEEALRIESPVKADFRLARRNATIGGVDIPAGTPVMLLNGAANRDPRRFECPAEFRLDRPNVKEHIAFGRGVHSCPGGPLARAEARISFERILDRMRDIRLSEEHHGPAGARRFTYEPTWVLRGLHELHIEFTPHVATTGDSNA